MLKKAQQKIPPAVLAKANLKDELPASFQRKFDGIVSAYAFHHLPLEMKGKVVKYLLDRHLQPGGRLVIGDIAFLNVADEARTRASLGSDWEQEYYWIADQTTSAFTPLKIIVTFLLITPFSGVFEFRAG